MMMSYVICITLCAFEASLKYTDTRKLSLVEFDFIFIMKQSPVIGHRLVDMLKNSVICCIVVFSFL